MGLPALAFEAEGAAVSSLPRPLGGACIRINSCVRSDGLMAELGARRWMLLCALTTYADTHGRCWPSQARLATDLRWGVRTVKRVLSELLAFRWCGEPLLSVEREPHHGVNRYRLAPIARPGAATEKRPMAREETGDRGQERPLNRGQDWPPEVYPGEVKRERAKKLGNAGAPPAGESLSLFGEEAKAETPKPKRKSGDGGPAGRLVSAFYRSLDERGVEHATPCYAREVGMAKRVIESAGSEAAALALLPLLRDDEWFQSRVRPNFGCFARMTESLLCRTAESHEEAESREHVARMQRLSWDSYTVEFHRRHPQDTRPESELPAYVRSALR